MPASTPSLLKKKLNLGDCQTRQIIITLLLRSKILPTHPAITEGQRKQAARRQ